MKTIVRLFLVVIAIFLTSACSEDHDCEEGIITSPNTVATVDGTSYQAALADCRLPKIQSFTLSGGTGGQIIGASGTVVTIASQSFADSNGVLIDGPVTIELLEFYTNGAIVACQLSTNTLNDMGSIEPTLAKGLVHISITFDNLPVTLLENIQVFIPDDTTTETLLQFTSPSCPEVTCRVLWERNPNTEVIGTTIDNPNGTQSTGYLTFVQNLGWLSIARFNQTSDRTTVYHKAPPGYEIGNSDVFLVYNNSEIGIGLLSIYNENLGVFDETFGEIPLDQETTFLFTSHDAQYQYSASSEIITPDIIGLTTSLLTASEEEFIAIINAF